MKRDIAHKAVKYFGTTTNPAEAGYILPDGRMLDLSGRHQASGYVNRRATNGDYLRGQRCVDHREVYDIVGQGGTPGMLAFMVATGAVRCHHSGGDWILSTVTGFTPQQIAVIARNLRGSIAVDFDDAQGNTVRTYEADYPTRGDVMRALCGASQL